MNHQVIQKLKEWRSRKANLEGIERYVVLHNKTIEEIANKLPKNEEEFKAIKGLGGKKFEKYGKDILALVRGCTGDYDKQDEAKMSDVSDDKEKVFSVSSFLDVVNVNLLRINVAIKGEISNFNFKRHAYFSLKDKDDESIVNCFMWARNYEISGIELKDGIEVIIRGYPEVYKPSGKFTFRVSSIELVGEGALKKAYEKLKKKLETEGLFDEARKKTMPVLPSKIGLITSKSGAVMNDFLNNLGRFGYNISLFDSRVEGAQAVNDLITAVRYFADKKIDVVVVIRGGGSLESLQAFNNEALIREIIDYPVPVICGIGHDKDVSLFSLVADRAESTPSFVAREINRSWEQAVEKINYCKSNIDYKFSSMLSEQKSELKNLLYLFSDFYQRIVERITVIDRIIANAVNNIEREIINKKSRIKEFTQGLTHNMSAVINDSEDQINSLIKFLEQNNPNRQLKLGYSIIFLGNGVVRSIQQVKKCDILKSRLSDGEIYSSVEDIKNKE